MKSHPACHQTPAIVRPRAVMIVKSPGPLTSGPVIGGFAAWTWHTLTRRA